MTLVFAWCLSNNFIDFLVSFLVVLLQEEAEHHIVVGFMNVERAEADIREICLAAVHGEHGSGTSRVGHYRFSHLIIVVGGRAWHTYCGFLCRILVINFELLASFVVLKRSFVILSVELEDSSEEIEIFKGKDVFIIVTVGCDVLNLIQIKSSLC